MYKKVIKTAVSEQLAAALDQSARKLGISRSERCVQIIEEHLRSGKKLSEKDVR